ncbi:MAG: TRAP transporter substrate-binding protein DctP [Actinomycetota bacterium]|nr:TRAP transporter substrate-binding protein DctP [Actinomycetota bacterium]
MSGSKTLRWVVVAVVTGAVAFALGGCGASASDKAGGAQRQQPRVLIMANANGAPFELEPFAAAVARLSGQTLRIDFKNDWRRGHPSDETGLINDVRAGKADLGWAGSRAFDSVGVRSFDALHAPLLIDSYALEQRVLQSPLASEMLTPLTPLGLIGLGILPGPMRKPLGVSPLVAPADYRGKTLATSRSPVAELTLRTLGASAKAIGPGASIAGLDGIEQQVASIYGNRYDRVGKYLTSNVNLWPRPLVLFINRHILATLNQTQRDALRGAAKSALPATLAQQQHDEKESVAGLCRTGLKFVTASAAELASLRRAVQPVYEHLARNPLTKAAITQIQMIGSAGPSPPDAPSCAKASATPTVAGQATPIDGVYRMTTTQHDTVAAGSTLADAGPSNYGTWIYVFDRGQFAITQDNQQACTWGYGTFSVTGNHVHWLFTDGGGFSPDNAVNKPGESFVFGWSRYRDTLTLTPVAGAISPLNFRVKPLRLLSSTPARHYLSKRCLPPAAALPGIK